MLIPVYNEKDTILEVVRRVQEQPFAKEIIIIDDCSTDGTRKVLEQTVWPPNVKLLYHDKNRGKGAGIRTGVQAATKDIIIIQDADLEYNPSDFGAVLRPIFDGVADVVYGSRFLGRHRVFMFTHYMGNRVVTLATNILYNTMLTDMETCYKVMRTEVLRSMTLESNGFGIEPELTAKIFRRRLRVYEVPISYDGRGYDEGKKIGWRDGVVAVWVLLKYRFGE